MTVNPGDQQQCHQARHSSGQKEPVPLPAASALPASKALISTVSVLKREVIGRIADHRINRIAELLPWSGRASPIHVAA